jgi:biopolymer transport protein ExbD
MKIKKAQSNILEGDMTPMIDMTFQLIAFLMVMVNFTADDVSQKLVLPESVLAKPPEGKPPEHRVIVQVTKNGTVIMGGDELSFDRVKTLLKNEAFAFQNKGVALGEAVIYIRADQECPTGKVQEVIKECQLQKFERFVLRAKEKGGN